MEQEIWLPESAKRDLVTRRINEGGVAVTEYGGERFAIMRADDPLLKSVQKAQAQGQAYRVSMSMHQMGLYEGIKEARAATLKTHAVLREIPRRNPVFAAVVRRRQNQVASYCRLPRWKGDTGFRVRLRDPEAKATPAATKEMKRVENVLLQGGVWRPHMETGEPGAWDAEGAVKAPSFVQANRALVWDSLTLDAAATRFEVGMDDKKHPVVFMSPVDAALIRYTVPRNAGKHAENARQSFVTRPYEPDIRKTERHIAYVMMDEAGMSIQREFKWNELSYLVRNPRTDTWVQGYGYSEAEMLIDAISGILYGLKYNTEFFDANHIPPGVLSMVGDYTDAQLDDFRKQLKMTVGGTGQFWAMPIITSKDGKAVEYVRMREDGDGMKWQGFIQFCTSIVCALYGMDATEIGMVNFGQSTSALGNSDNAERLKLQQEYGLVPLLGMFEEYWDNAVVRKYDEDFRFEFQAVSAPNAEEKRAEDQFRFQMAVLTPNEWRAANDEPPIKDPTDRALYDQIDQYVRAKVSEGEDEESVKKVVQTAYEKQGGEWAQWPDAPVGNPQALMLWQTEHGIGQDGGMGDMMGGDPNDPNAQGQDGEEDQQETPPHKYAFPDGDEQPQAPVPGQQTVVPGMVQPTGKPGGKPDPQGAAQMPPGAMRKSLSEQAFDIFIRRRLPRGR